MDSAGPSPRRRSEGHGGSKFHSKKRKKRSSDVIEEVRENSKSARLYESGGGKEERSTRKNLELILSLQDKNVDILKNINLAFDYAKSSNIEDMDDNGQSLQVLDASRTIVFLNNWIQSVLISSEKKMSHDEEAPQIETSGSVMDLRCWKIFHLCLKESKNLHISLTCSRDFLRVIHSIARDASYFINKMSLFVEETLSGERLQIYDIVLDCVSMVFSFHGGIAKENIDLWILLMDKVIDSALKVVMGQLDGSKLGNFILQLACYLFEDEKLVNKSYHRHLFDKVEKIVAKQNENWR